MDLKKLQELRWETEIYSVEYFMIEYEISEYLMGKSVNDFWKFWISILLNNYCYFVDGFRVPSHNELWVKNLAVACYLAEFVEKMTGIESYLNYKGEC